MPATVGATRQGRRRSTRSGPPSSHSLEPADRKGVAALREAEVGNSAQAIRLAANALAGAPNRIGQLGIALAFARAGNIEQAQKLADALSQHDPLNTMVQNFSLPTIRA